MSLPRSGSQSRRTLRVGKPPPSSRAVWLAIFVLLSVGACDRSGSPDKIAAANVETPLDSAHESATDSESVANARPRRIILISLDTVGAKHVSGYSDARTPTLEKIARDGVRFEDYYSASTYTLPSHMSMLTGLDPTEHGVVSLQARLAPEVPTLASKLASAGFRTKAVVEGGFVRKEYGFDQGFDDFEERAHGQVPRTSIWGILDWMKGEGEAPYFLFIHTYVAHTPYGGYYDIRSRRSELDLPNETEISALKKKYNREKHYAPPKGIDPELQHICTFYNATSKDKADFMSCGRRMIKADFRNSRHFDIYREELLRSYRAAIRRGGRMVGQIRDTLIELGQLEDTLLIVTSDHGDSMWEHSVHGHDYSPFNEVVKVPLILSYPRRIKGPQVILGLAWNLDLLPTILSLAQVDFDTTLQGEDLSAVMLGQKEIPNVRTIYPLLLRPANRTHLPRRRMVLRGDTKFIEGHELYGDPEGLLFDLKTSPGEDENLRRARSEMFEEFQELAADYDGSLTPGEPIHQETGERISPFPEDAEPYDMPENLERGLAELGYIVDDELSDSAE